MENKILKGEKIMKNFAKYICLFLVVFGINVSLFGSESYTFQSFASSQTTVSITTPTDFTITMNKLSGAGSGQYPTWNGTTSEAKLYHHHNMVIASTTKTITRIIYHYNDNEGSSGQHLTATANCGTLGDYNSTKKTHQWEGSATSVTLTLSGTGGNYGFTSVEVFFSDDVDPGDTDYIQVENIVLNTLEDYGSHQFRIDGNVCTDGYYPNNYYQISIADQADAAWYITNAMVKSNDYGYAQGELQWYFDAPGTYRTYITIRAKANDCSTDKTINVPVTVTYSLTPATYAVTYNSNGANSGSVPTDTYSPYDNGATVTVLGNSGNLVKTGKYFSGWNTRENGSGTHFDEGDEFTIRGEAVTLYAEWKTASTITLSANGHGTDGSATGVMNGEVVDFTAVVPAETYIITGYYTAASSGEMVLSPTGVVYPDITNYTDAEGNWIRNSATTLYAHYGTRYGNYASFCERSIEFNMNGQDAATNMPSTISGLKARVVVPENKRPTETPEVAGYAFAGWYKEEACTNAWDWETSTVATTEVTTLYAMWTAGVTDLTILANNGTDSEENSACQVTYGSSDAICAGSFTAPAGYTYNGLWTAREGGSQLFNIDGSQVSTDVASIISSTNGWISTDEEMEIYAQWACTEPTNVAISGAWDYFGGETISLSVTADNKAADVRYQWNHNGVPMPGKTSATLTVENCTVADAGSYTCTVTNGSTCGVTSSNFDVKVYALRGFVDWSTDVDFVREGDTKVGVARVNLTADSNYEFKVYVTTGTAYGNNGTITGNVDNWTFQSDRSNCKLRSSMAGEYVITIDYTNATQPTISVQYPAADQAAGYKIYFANDETQWSNLTYRIGHDTYVNNPTTALTQVPGTRNLWVVTTPNFNGFQAWHIGNQTGWAGDNSIFKTTTNGEQASIAITNSTVFQKSAVAQDVTVIPGSTHSTGTDAGKNDNCEFWGVSRQNGMLAHNVTINSYANGTITVDYVDINGDAQNMTSGNADLAHTCILTISASADTRYVLSSLTVNGSPFVSGSTLDLTEDIVINAVFTQNVFTFTLDKNLGTADGSVTFTLNGTSADELSFTGTRTGYTLQGFNSTAGTNGAGGGTKVLNIDGTINNYSSWVVDGAWKLTDESKKLYAAWKANRYYVRYNANDGTGTMENTEFTYDAAAKALRKNTFTRTGYTFQGWATTAEGAVAYSDQQTVQNLTDVNNAIVDLYAVWTINQFDVTYHHAGSDHVEPVNYNANPTGFMPDECSADRVFVGWSEREVAMTQTEPTTVTPTTFKITAAKEFWAVYACKNGGKVTGSERVSRSVNTIQSNHATIVDNFEFGSATYSNASGTENWMSLDFKSQTNHLTTKSKITDLSAVEVTWRANGAAANDVEIRISEDAANWTTIQTVASVSTSSSANPKFDLPIVGDYYVEIFIPARTNSTNKLLFNNVTFYSKQRTFYNTDYATSCEKAASMTLTYDADGGTEQTAVTEAGWVTLPTAGECERGCYTLTGWLCSGDDKTYEPGAQYLLNHDVTMTAQWTLNGTEEHDVTYYTGQEGDEGATIQVVCGAYADIADPVSCDGNRYHFEGWTTDGSYAESAEAPVLFNIATQPVEGDLTLYAVWSHGKNIFTKENRGTDAVAAGDKIILVEPTSHLALTSLLLSAEVEETRENVIETDETVYVWDVLAADGEKLTLRGTNGNLHISGNTTTSLEVLNDVNYAAAEYKGFKITKSESYIYAITQDVEGDKTRRVNYNAKKGIWNTYATRTLGNIYRKTGSTGKTYSLDGYCAHEYFATGVSEMTSGKDVAVLSTTGTVAVSHTSKLPVAEKVSGDDVFVVTVNPTSTGTNGDGSLNYEYTVKFTPTAGNQTYSAVYQFVGEDEHVGDTKVIASEEITFTGYSLPDEFAIVVNRGGQYYALPGGIASAGTPNAVPVTVVGGEVVDLGAENAYHVHTGAVTGETARTTLRLVTEAGALWATHADNANINDYNGDLTSKTAAASTTNTQWTLERVYNESTDAFEGYHLSSDANTTKALFYQSTNNHWGYYNNSYYNGGAYNGEIFFLPIQAQLGDMMDIIEWNSNSVVLNLNGYAASAGAWGVKNASDEMLLSGNRAGDRTLEVSTATLVADQYLNIKVYGNANNAPAEPVVESNRNYKIPHVMEGTQSISSAASYSATSILYIKSGVTTVNVNLTVAKVVVCPGAELVIANGKTLITTDLVLRGKVWSYEQPILTNNGTLTVTGHSYYARITPTGGDAKKYYQIGLPYASTIGGVRLSNGATTNYGADRNWNIQSYDVEGRAANGKQDANWVNVASTATLNANQGYIMASASQYYREYYFPISVASTGNGGTSVAVKPTTAQSAAVNNNWNFITSPSTTVMTVTIGDPSEAPKISELTEDNKTYWQHIPTALKPFFPVYYQAAEAGTLNFAATQNRIIAKAQDVKLSTQWIQLFLENEQGDKDETTVFVNEDKFAADYEMGYDVAKFKSESARPQVYTRMACGDLAFNALPDSIAETRIPVGVSTGSAKTLTFSLGTEDYLDRVEHVYLVDAFMGSTVDLLLSDYTWSVEDGVDGRFYLNIAMKKAPQTPTDIGDVSGGDGREIKKIILEDKLFIIVEGRVYDATGKIVK